MRISSRKIENWIAGFAMARAGGNEGKRKREVMAISQEEACESKGDAVLEQKSGDMEEKYGVTK